MTELWPRIEDHPNRENLTTAKSSGKGPCYMVHLHQAEYNHARKCVNACAELGDDPAAEIKNSHKQGKELSWEIENVKRTHWVEIERLKTIIEELTGDNVKKDGEIERLKEEINLAEAYFRETDKANPAGDFWQGDR